VTLRPPHWQADRLGLGPSESGSAAAGPSLARWHLLGKERVTGTVPVTEGSWPQAAAAPAEARKWLLY
jgi:hypothetical protein